MPITAPAVGDPTKQTLIQSIIDALAAAEVDIAAIVGERLVTNGSFEVDSDSDGFPDQWTRTLYTGGAFALVDDTGTGANSAHGLKAIQFTHPGGGGNGGGEIVTHADTYIEVAALRPYYVTWMNKNSVATVTNSVEVLEYDATETLLATTVIYSTTTGPTAWTHLNARFACTNALTRYAKLKFKCGETSASTACVIYIDNVVMQTLPFKNEVIMRNSTAVTVGGVIENQFWRAPAGVYLAEFIAIGAGGEGSEGGSGSNQGGGGGGGGAYARSILSVTPGTKYYPKIGTGGNNGSASGEDGFDSEITVGAVTLVGGGGDGATNAGGVGGAGGTATGGQENVSGNAGVTRPGIGNEGGMGGDCPYFGVGALGNASASTLAKQDAPEFPGAGGGGGQALPGPGSATGGFGAGGAVIIRW
jgi:hypothetical protein